MRTLHLLLICFTGLFFIHSCASDATVDDLDRSEWELEIYDSIVFAADYQYVIMSDYNRGKGLFLGFNRSKREVILFDKKGNVKHSFFSHEKALGQFITGYSFFNDSLIVLTGIYGYAIYNLDGRTVKASNFREHEFLVSVNQWKVLSKYVDNEQYLILPGNDVPQGPMKPDRLKKYPFVSVYNVNDSTYRSGAFFTDDSPYLKEHIQMLGPIFRVSL